MNAFYDQLAYGLILFWALFRLFDLVSKTRIALGLGLAATVLVLSVGGLFNHMMIAAFAPFGLLLPALALRNILCMSGVPAEPFRRLDVLVLLAGYVLFLCAALGVFSFEPYRLGYHPLPGGAVALAALAYLLWRGQFVLAGAVLLGQFAWVFGIGSPNLFDHLGHALLVPVMAIYLLNTSLFAPLRRRLTRT